jgi:hypothetical protein
MTIKKLIQKYIKLPKQYETVTIAQVLSDLSLIQLRNK